MTSSVSYQKPQERESARTSPKASPKASDMSLWGAEPRHPRARRTQGAEAAAGQAEEGAAQGGELVAPEPSGREAGW